MESGMLNSLHNEEEQFTIERRASHDSQSPQWSGDTVGNGSHLSPQSEEGAGEDFDRTLSDWRRHVASMPMSDSEDYIVDDVLNDTPSPCKAEKFSFSPDSLSPQIKTDNLSIKPENIISSNNSIYAGKVRGDNRMMDNDNTSRKGNLYATIDSVVYELDSDPNEKYIAYHGNSELDSDFISNTIQVISVDPDTLDISDTSSEGSIESSRCSSPSTYCSDSEEEQNNELNLSASSSYNSSTLEEVEYCAEDINSIINEVPSKVDSSDVGLLGSKCIQGSSCTIIQDELSTNDGSKNSSAQTNKDSSPSCVLMNCNVTPETNNSKRQKLKSVSLPQSPSHGVELTGLDFQPSMTFEDLKLIDFDRMFNISPSKVFSKNFEMPDVFDENVPHFPENVSFDPVVDIKVEKINNSQLNECKTDATTNDIIEIIDKNSMLEKVMNSSDLLFNSKMEDCDLGEDIHNFDLPSFIMGESHGDPNELLKENFISSPLMMKSEQNVAENIRRDSIDNFDKFDMSKLPNIIMSTPKKACKIISDMRIIRSTSPWPLKIMESPIAKYCAKTPIKMKSGFASYPNEPLVMRITKSEGNKTPKEDSEDYVDVETVSDGESFPVLAANNLDSLLEQFEATEKLSKNADCESKTAEGGVKVEPFKNYNDGHWDVVANKDEQFSTAWSLPSKLPHHVKRNSSLKTPERVHRASISETSSFVSPCLSKSLQNTSTESVQLDHDYCSPVRQNSNHIRTISSSTDGDSESSKSLLDDSSFISPKASSIASFYKQINSCNRRLGLGKGKNIAMCMEHRTDEFRENAETSSVLINPMKKPVNKSDSLLKVNDIISNSCRSDLSDSDCSMSDHSYSKVESINNAEYLSPVKNRSVLQLGKLNKTNKTIQVSAQQPKKSEVTETVIDIACNKNVKKSVVVTFKSDSEHLPELNINNCERLSDLNKSGKALPKNVKVNKNSLLINSFNNNCDKLIVKQDKPVIRPKQSLLKPIVKEEIRKVSLLKNNCIDRNIIPVMKENINVECFQATELVLKSSENVPIKEVVPQKAIETSPIEVLLPGEPKENSTETVNLVEKKQPLKRKLNLEEYKKRREGNTRSCETSRTSSPIAVFCDNWAFSTPNSPAPLTNHDLPPPKPELTSVHTPSLTEMLQNVLSNSKHAVAEVLPAKPTAVAQIKKDVVKTGETETKLFDPIAEASKKALQMKKLSARRCNEDKLIQSKISKQENVVILPIVSENGKLLPMIKKADDVTIEIPIVTPVRRKNSEYEEIVMVSVGVNTNPVTFLDPDPDTISDELFPCDESSKNGIQFKIKKKNNAIVQKNIFDNILISTELSSKVVEEADGTFNSNFSSSDNSNLAKSKSVNETIKKISVKEKVTKLKEGKPNVNLLNLNATLQKVEMRKDLKISSNSLLSSIQKVVHKKNCANKSPESGNDSTHHGSSSKHYSEKGKHLDHVHHSEKNKHPDRIEKVKFSDRQEKIKQLPDRAQAKQIIICEPIKAVKPKEISKSPISDSGKEKSFLISDIVTDDSSILDHGENKVIMHLKKNRTKPEMCSLSVQTDSNVIIEDFVEEVVASPADIEIVEAVVADSNDIENITSENNTLGNNIVSEINEDVLNDKVNGISNDKKERSYRKRKESSSSDGSLENGNSSNKRRGYGRGYSTSSRRTNSIERHRKSYSPPRGRYRSRSPGRWNKRNRNDRGCYRSSRNRDTRYSRRSRSISRDRRKHYDSRDSSNRGFSSNRQDRRNSRSRGYHHDNLSVRSVPSSSKRRRISSRSPNNIKRKPSSSDSFDKNSSIGSSKCSVSRTRDCHVTEKIDNIKRDDVKIETPAQSETDNWIEMNGHRNDGSRRRKSTERSTRSNSSESSSSSEGSCSSSTSSSSSSSSSGSSYDSEESSVFHSGKDSKSAKGNRFSASVESGPITRSHPQRKAEPIEERRVVFIGRLEQDITKEDLRRKFVKYGQVMEVTLHRKDDGTRYGFVTFSKAEQSYRVVERANLDSELNRYDVSFGGRRAFCRHLYADLDDLETMEELDYYGGAVRRLPPLPRDKNSFDSLLEEMRMAVEAKRARQRGDSPRM